MDENKQKEAGFRPTFKNKIDEAFWMVEIWTANAQVVFSTKC